MLLTRLLNRLIRVGALTVIDATGKAHLFEGDDGPAVTIRLHDRALHSRLFFRPQFHLGTAYMNGTLTVEDAPLYDFLNLIGINLEIAENLPVGAMADNLDRLFRRVQQYNPLTCARRNVAHHYDLSDSFYALFLDSDWQYSCGYFSSGSEDLETAQLQKKRHIAAKLCLEQGQRVLDIGSGWGGLGLYLAKEMNTDVTGLTLSTEQIDVARARAAAEGMADTVRFDLRDYREQTGTFDRIVSVGMFEHVGVCHFQTFFNKVRDLLSDDGVALLHTIGRAEKPGSTNAWIRRYIFPGGYIPALSEITRAIEKTGLWITDVEVLRLHYAETLRHWRQRFLANRSKAEALYDDRFYRMWEFYLAVSEISFRYLRNVVFQIQLTKRQDAVPLNRAYIDDGERRIASGSTWAA
jgi:cyclopropane-fatty-acyl-phospholipid synthase